MNRSEISLLLGTAAAYDQRTLGEADVEAWHVALGDLDHGEAHQAVIEHYTRSTDWLKPAHLRTRVTQLRRERLANADLAIPPADPDQPGHAYAAQLRQHLHQLATEATQPPQLAPATTNRTEPSDAARAELDAARAACAQATTRRNPSTPAATSPSRGQTSGPVTMPQPLTAAELYTAATSTITTQAPQGDTDDTEPSA